MQINGLLRPGEPGPVLCSIFKVYDSLHCAAHCRDSAFSLSMNVTQSLDTVCFKEEGWDMRHHAIHSKHYDLMSVHFRNPACSFELDF